MRIRVVERLDEFPAARWNALVADDNPFLRHEFLSSLERNGCVGEAAGWLPHHLVGEDDDGSLAGAVPLYLKDNSFGEFVFDWGWADAYQRNGVSYYPKLVCAVPFTPATGQRLLLAAGEQQTENAAALLREALHQAEQLNCSSLHCLFLNEHDHRHLTTSGFMTRLGCHFHWHNPGYADFAAFLSALNAKKRKNIKRERRLVAESGIEFQVLAGDAVSEGQWRSFHQFYSNTFLIRGRYPPLSIEFFLDIAERMGEQIVLVLARSAGRDVAGAISFKSASALFGRHWGCLAEYDSLHFECCYYQGIDYCIRHGLERFEPGVQGEHKIWRGFLPTITRSAHWMAHPAFSDAIKDFLNRETPAVQAYARELNSHSPFRQAESAE